MTKRESISKSIRFEVFKRDKFTCQYCGKVAPDVILTIDHILPVSKGGDNDITNLITACDDCNSGKGSRLLNDDVALLRRKKQLDDLQEKRDQLEMMMEWHRGLVKLDDTEAESVADFWGELFEGKFMVNQAGVDMAKKWIQKYGLNEVMESLKLSVSQYVPDKDDVTTVEAEKTWTMIPRICQSRKAISKEPHLRDIFYIRGIVRRRMYCNDWLALDLLKKAYNSGVDIDELKEIAINSKNWTTWRQTMESLIGMAEE